MAFDVYQKVTEQILEQLESGVVPWKRHYSLGPSRSFVTGKEYTGINRWLLYPGKYESPYWLTFNQTTKLGGKVKKGEHGHMAVFFKIWEKETPDGPATIPVLRYYTVFNLGQVELPPKIVEKQTPCEIMTEVTAPAIVDNYEHGPKIIEGPRPAYQPKADCVVMPGERTFASRDDYFLTFFHELIHSTGHEQRLDRKLSGTQLNGGFGKEELIAEMGAAYLGGLTHIQKTVEVQASYLAGWIKALDEDRRLVVYAAGQAEKAAKWILGERNQREGEK